MMKDLLGAFAQVAEGQLPESRDTVADCLVHIAAVLVQEFCEGTSPVGRELGHLATALQNDEDPYVSSMALGTRMQMRMALNHITKAKERVHHA